MKHYYQITRRTKMIMSNDSTFYRSCIIEESYGYKAQETKEVYTGLKPLQIISFNCKLSGSTLSGRKEVVKDILKSSSKIPIPIIPQQGIYIFPTTSSKNKNCIWLSYRHIKNYEEYNKNQTIVTFIDGTSKIIHTSKAIFDKQYKRASQVIVYFNRNTLFGKGPKLW
ncbi:competence protein ComK [Oceanobacillus halophilus]|uniref:Competence protein n=1 Tax=Oceanobacillus halophilus TaxID=930130 RepID=A0A495A501_9BACI|nr:competence protein ComK [Oceanobacillus halophilus]RKQ34349.1 competence protein [Oceanobacillus halophilus]